MNLLRPVQWIIPALISSRRMIRISEESRAHCSPLWFSYQRPLSALAIYNRNHTLSQLTLFLNAISVSTNGAIAL